MGIEILSLHLPLPLPFFPLTGVASTLSATRGASDFDIALLAPSKLLLVRAQMPHV